MATNNIILAVPGADSSVLARLPESDSAQLSFSPEDIDGLKLDANGGLVISFVQGGQVTLENFQSFIDNGNTLSLADGTNVDPKLLFNALGGEMTNPFPGSDVAHIGIPAAGAKQDITLEAGKKYLFDFDLSETKSADVKDGKMVIDFKNGGNITIDNYETAMASGTPPELSLASKTCVVSGDELITNIQELAKAGALDATALALAEKEKEEELKRKSELAKAEMNGADDTGVLGETGLAYRAGEVAEGEAKSEDSGSDAAKMEAKAREANEIKTASGEEAIAKQLAQIETAAGGPAGGARNSGYGYRSSPDSDPFVTNPDIGPINPTQLGYRAPLLEPGRYLAPEGERPRPDGNPSIIQPGAQYVDETNLDGGPVSVSGELNINFGADGPGSVTPNNNFTSGGSLDNGALTSNGDAITVTVEGNAYVGKTPGGDVVFELSIDPRDGDYTFTQYLPLDHADGTNANDQILLNFGVTARDRDGDPISTTIQIVVADDAPTASGASETIDETDLRDGPITETGSITVDFGQDGAGEVVTTNQFTPSGSLDNGVLSHNGVPIVVTETASGYVGVAGTETVFTLAINPATGAYEFVLYESLDHADNTNPNDVITLTFGTRVIDYDGDTADANIVINIRDDAPTFQPPGEPEDPENPPEEPPVPGNPTPDHGLETVDETNLAGGPVIETGKLDADFGADSPGSYAFIPNAFASDGSKKDGALTHQGVPVVVTIEGGAYVGRAGDVTVFTLNLNTTTGDYTFTLLQELDHADGSDPNDVITLHFGVRASDSEGESADGSIQINIRDDAPDAKDDTRSVDEGRTITGNVTSNDVVGQDTPGAVTKVQFGATTYDVPSSGQLTVVGAHGTLQIAANGAYSYTSNANAEGVDRFTYTLRDRDGDVDTAILKITVNDVDTCPVIVKPGAEVVDETNLKDGVITEEGSVTADFLDDGPGRFEGTGGFTSGGSKAGGNLTSGGVPVVVTLVGDTYTGRAGDVVVFTLQIAENGNYTFQLREQLDHADGSNPDDIIDLNFGVRAVDADGDSDATTIQIRVKDDAPDAKDDTVTAGAGKTVTGNVMNNDIVGQDTPGKVTKVTFNGTSYDVPATGQATINGAYGTLKIAANGAYSYTAKSNVADGVDNFKYTLSDRDGDTDTAKLSVCVEEAPVKVDLCVNNNVDDVCVKEDKSVSVPVTASFTGGSGNEVMTLTLTGVTTGWVITGAGWVNAGGGIYTLTLPAGQKSYDGSLNFKPPANSDVDLNGLNIKASVYDPDSAATKVVNDGFRVIVDAVADPISFEASYVPSGDGKYAFTRTDKTYTRHTKLIIDNLTRPDADGSESLKKIVFTIPKVLGDSLYISIKGATSGVFTKVGEATTNAQGTTYSINLEGKTYAEALSYIDRLHLTHKSEPSKFHGAYNVGIEIVNYEKNLSGVEKDYSDNESKFFVSLPVYFCVTPIAIDLDGDGVELRSITEGVLFDMTNDGVKDKTGWVGKDDGFLALDKNKDGIINDRSELFGDTENFSDGFANLSSYDSNKDGVIDAKDAVFKDLVIWQDANGDGITQDGELRSLKDHGIKSISLNAAEVDYDIAGNPVTHESTVTFDNGETSKVVDAWFTYKDGAVEINGQTFVGSDGNDVFIGSDGSDTFTGGAGADTFLYNAINEGVDRIKDFNQAEGDTLDLSGMISNFDPLTDAINDFVFAKEEGGNTVISVNIAGTGEATAKAIVVLEGVDVSVNDLLHNGSLVA